MHGPRLFTRTHLLALAALMLLPACSPRKPIPSDPPEVRTEAMVRGAARKAAQAEAPQPVAEAKPAEPAKPDVVVAHVSDTDAKPATDAANAAATKPAEPKAEAAKAPEAAPAVPAEAKAADAKPVETKAEGAKADVKPEVKADVKTEPAKAAPKPEPSAAAQADATAQAAKAAADPATQAVSKTPTVQIASFSTEKNADAALAWLKEKGYAEARVVRVEQGQAVYHRVQAGPFQDPAAARKALEELKADWPQAFIPAD